MSGAEKCARKSMQIRVAVLLGVDVAGDCQSLVHVHVLEESARAHCALVEVSKRRAGSSNAS